MFQFKVFVIAAIFNALWCNVDSKSVISTLAGTGPVGSQDGTYSGDGGAATLANLNNPEDVTTDAFGSIYIADKVNNRIRRVIFEDADINSGKINNQIVTVAGNGKAGFSGDGGAATDASLYFPVGVSVFQNRKKNRNNKLEDGDAEYDHVLLIADSYNNRVRMVDLRSGIMSTLAGSGEEYSDVSGDGGPAVRAFLNNPTAAVAAFVGADSDISSGIDMDEKTYNSVLIVDSFNHRIRRVSLQDGTISTIAGNGLPGISGDGGPAAMANLHRPFGVAVDSSSKNAFIADFFGNRIRKLSLTTGIISTIAGGNGVHGYAGNGGVALSATLYSPQRVTVDCHDNIYFIDYFNQMVRFINSQTNVISTIAGNDSREAGFSGDGGLATLSSLNAPMGLSLDANNNVLIADSNNHRIRIVTAVVGPCRLGGAQHEL